MAMSERKNKYGNHKIVHERWGVFDSDLEMARYIFLMEREKKGEISDLRRQVEFSLIPSQYKAVEVKLKTKTKVVDRLLYGGVTYRADFVYKRDGETIVEDCKGEDTTYYKDGKKKRFSTQTADFKIKMKLMYYFHKIEIKIVSIPTFWEKDTEK